jgi:hypothetical protein
VARNVEIPTRLVARNCQLSRNHPDASTLGVLHLRLAGSEQYKEVPFAVCIECP